MIHKRWLVRAIAALAVLSMLAAACGGDDDDGGGSEAAEDVDPNGELRLSASLAQTGLFFDLTTQVSVPLIWHPMIFDTLLRRQADGGIEPGLAKKATVVDSSTLTVELNSGIKFSDGTPLDAEAVKFGIERNINLGKQGSFEAELYQLGSITVDSPTELTIKLKTPVAGAWYRLLTLPETSPVSPTAAKAGTDFNKTPVGAGPFTVESFAVEDHVTLAKNPTYFEASKIRLAKITFVHVTPESLGNALRSKTVDLSNSVPYAVAEGLVGTGLEVSTSVSDNSLLQGHICKSRPPFNDLRVRQAVNYALDRDELNAIYDGKGEPMWGFFASDSIFHDPSLEDFYKRDIPKAKSLLAAAGMPNLAFDMYFPAGLDGQRAAEVFQQQVAEAGITVTLKPAQADFFPEALGAPIQFFALQRSGLQKVTRVYVPGSYGNVCNWNDPELNELVAKIQAVQEDSPEGIKLWKELQRHALETAVTIFGLFGVQTQVWDDSRVGDVSFRFLSTQPIPDFYGMYITG
ncbi:MAG: ABC transporter substrate-binding protein [Acidimicrobiia bacterium]